MQGTPPSRTGKATGESEKGFTQAARAAAEDAAKKGWGHGLHHNVKVELEVDVEIKNPGFVPTFRVTIS